jgi:hypothetical protein
MCAASAGRRKTGGPAAPFDEREPVFLLLLVMIFPAIRRKREEAVEEPAIGKTAAST